MILYKTVAKEAEAEQIIEKSKFIAHIRSVDSREEAEAYIDDIRARFRDATHNVPAMVIGEKSQIQWASDDGEPQGTSGAPVVQMLVSEGLTNVVMVITRYFGGIKLGPGGLVRAYTGTAKLALDNAGIRAVREMYSMKVKLEYSLLSKVQKYAAEGEFTIEKIVYEDVITAVLTCESEKEMRMKSLIAGISAGKEKIVSEVRKNA